MGDISTKRFHLGWFTAFGVPDWQGVWATADREWASGEMYFHLAREIERACFDYVLVEDTLMVSDVFGGTAEVELRAAVQSPKQDPLLLAAAMSQVTSALGLVPTLSTSFYPPFLLARAVSTLDSLSGGRAGWNIVTSGSERAAQNFGIERLPEHDSRYDIADEYLELVTALWDSWEPGALVMDRESGVFADHRNVHRVDFRGAHYASRGPLNTVRAPQGRPVLAQAGSSKRGLRFAARWADTVVVLRKGEAAMRRYRDDLRRAAREQGRDPDDIKVLWLVGPVLAETEREAHEIVARSRPRTADEVRERLAGLSAITNIDFASFDVDAPLSDLKARLVTDGERGTLESFLAGGHRTLREVVTEGSGGCVPLVGTPGQIAERLHDVDVAVGGDGYLLRVPGGRLNRRYVSEVVDGLVAELQRRAACRTEYTSGLLRSHLREF